MHVCFGFTKKKEMYENAYSNLNLVLFAHTEAGGLWEILFQKVVHVHCKWFDQEPVNKRAQFHALFVIL